MAELETFIENARGETVRLAPCSNPQHIAHFQAGRAVVSCGKCVMEVVPQPHSIHEQESK